jgi:hypothetical protein
MIPLHYCAPAQGSLLAIGGSVDRWIGDFAIR